MSEKRSELYKSIIGSVLSSDSNIQIDRIDNSRVEVTYLSNMGDGRKVKRDISFTTLLRFELNGKYSLSNNSQDYKFKVEVFLDQGIFRDKYYTKINVIRGDSYSSSDVDASYFFLNNEVKNEQLKLFNIIKGLYEKYEVEKKSAKINKHIDSLKKTIKKELLRDDTINDILDN